MDGYQVFVWRRGGVWESGDGEVLRARDIFFDLDCSHGVRISFSGRCQKERKWREVNAISEELLL